MRRLPLSLTLAALALLGPQGYAQDVLTGTASLTTQGDLSSQMVEGIRKFLVRATDESASKRSRLWQPDFQSIDRYEASVAPNRERLRQILGAVDARIPPGPFEIIASVGQPPLVAEAGSWRAYAVRWNVFEGVHGEGLLLQPKDPAAARVVAIPDAGQTPELIAGLVAGLPPERQFARRLVENGCEVLVPVLLSRDDTYSGTKSINRFTNQPHREWIYRQAYELGRHIIGYEVQKIEAALDIWAADGASAAPPIGVVGYGEGGLIAFYSAALDTRIKATLVSGFFDRREQVSRQPIYRNVFGLLREFGDAEVALLVLPRMLVVEHSRGPEVEGPPKPREGRNGAAPGNLAAQDYASVESEFERARSLIAAAPRSFQDKLALVSGAEGMAVGPGSESGLADFLTGLGFRMEGPKPPGDASRVIRGGFAVNERQERQVRELEEHTQRVFRDPERVRGDFFWGKTKGLSPESWERERETFRRILWENVLGKVPGSVPPPNARARQLPAPANTTSNWTGYEVMLDVRPDVFAWGYLLLPRGIPSGERRPVVVCQHGLEGVPADLLNEDTQSEGFRYYGAFAARLAERGFVVFVPHNPYRGGDKFRQLQRLANPLGLSLFSFIIAQHEQLLNWLSGLPFVDPQRIGFYGLSYGGKTAMRVPAVLEKYALSICSGDFNEWVRKNVSLDYPASYMFLGEYEMPEFNLGGTFNYAEMAALIAPRPFMVERGHNDGVGLDEWVAYEYAKVRRFYDQMEIGDRTEIEFFNGGHKINGEGTFRFLENHLHFPSR